VAVNSDSDSDTGIELEWHIDARCFRCGAPRELSGHLRVWGDETIITETDEPCDQCGERKIRTRFGVEEL
jgi:hypothetical protein